MHSGQSNNASLGERAPQRPACVPRQHLEQSTSPHRSACSTADSSGSSVFLWHRTGSNMAAESSPRHAHGQCVAQTYVRKTVRQTTTRSVMHLTGEVCRMTRTRKRQLNFEKYQHSACTQHPIPQPTESDNGNAWIHDITAYGDTSAATHTVRKISIQYPRKQVAQTTIRTVAY